MAACDETPVARSFIPRDLTLPGKCLPPALPFIISMQDRWDPDSCKLIRETDQHHNHHHLQLVSDTLQLLETVNKPVAVLSICGLFRSGKSYFLSRLLGRPGAFEMSHGWLACTRGVWMATTVLECEEFAIVLLDTEGTECVGSSQAVVMNLLAVTTLLSSYLIYNSKRVPEQADLDKIRCTAHLSTSLLIQKEGCRRVDIMKRFFPHFLWLLRDVMLEMTNRTGEIISPTDFLHSRLLASESGQPTELGKFLCSLFPSLECHTLPRPTTNPTLMKNIVEEQVKLNPAFNRAVDKLIQQILLQVKPKKSTNGVSIVDGPALAALACEYVNAINTSGAIPNMEQGWQAILKCKLKEQAEKLVKEYRQEMEECLTGNLPMEERNLKRIHEQTLSRKRKSLQKEIYHLNPLSSTSEGEDPVLGQLEQAICQTNNEGQVIGGVLFQFTSQNYFRSKQKCEDVLREAIENSAIHKKCHEAFINSQPLDINRQIQEIDEQYHKRAVGPAVSEVLEMGHRELNELGNVLNRIPGPPAEVRVIGQGPDQVKLSWQPPKENPQATECYVVWKREKGREWERVRATKKTKTLITGLKSDTDYEFVVTATNDLVKSVEKKTDAETKSSLTKGALMGAAASIGVVAFLFEAVQGGTMSYGQTLATLIASILCAPVVAPVMAAWGVKEAMREQYSGDLSPESDDDRP